MRLPNMTYPRQDWDNFFKMSVTDGSLKPDIGEAIPLKAVNIWESMLPIMVQEWSHTEIKSLHTVTITEKHGYVSCFITR